MLHFFIIEMCPFHSHTFIRQRDSNESLHLCLRGPADLVGWQPRIAASNEKYLVWFEYWGRGGLRKLVGCHDFYPLLLIIGQFSISEEQFSLNEDGKAIIAKPQLLSIDKRNA
jgi:hypothetical protein